MKSAKIIYQLMNDLLKYLLKYGMLDRFTEQDVEQALADSEAICERYRRAPRGIGYLAKKMCEAVNSYLMQLGKRNS